MVAAKNARILFADGELLSAIGCGVMQRNGADAISTAGT